MPGSRSMRGWMGGPLNRVGDTGDAVFRKQRPQVGGQDLLGQTHPVEGVAHRRACIAGGTGCIVRLSGYSSGDSQVADRGETVDLGGLGTLSAAMNSLGLWARGSIPGPKAATQGMPAVS